jgi:hypothetical protein
MSMLPMDGDRYSISTNSLDGRRIPSADQPSTQIRIVTPEAFAALHLRLKSGREFASADRGGAPPVVIVNESAARKLWNGVDPVGHTLTISTRFTEDTSRAAAPWSASSPTFTMPHWAPRRVRSSSFLTRRRPGAI